MSNYYLLLCAQGRRVPPHSGRPRLSLISVRLIKAHEASEVAGRDRRKARQRTFPGASWARQASPSASLATCLLLLPCRLLATSFHEDGVVDTRERVPKPHLAFQCNMWHKWHLVGSTSSSDRFKTKAKRAYIFLFNQAQVHSRYEFLFLHITASGLLRWYQRERGSWYIIYSNNDVQFLICVCWKKNTHPHLDMYHLKSYLTRAQVISGFWWT